MFKNPELLVKYTIMYHREGDSYNKVKSFAFMQSYPPLPQDKRRLLSVSPRGGGGRKVRLHVCMHYENSYSTTATVTSTIPESFQHLIGNCFNQGPCSLITYQPINYMNRKEDLRETAEEQPRKLTFLIPRKNFVCYLLLSLFFCCYRVKQQIPERIL